MGSVKFSLGRLWVHSFRLVDRRLSCIGIVVVFVDDAN